jgi:Ca2+-binding EF-hand superfamily protein
MASLFLLAVTLSSAQAVMFLQPDDDHFVDELHDNAVPKVAANKPGTALEKDFVDMDTNNDKQLEPEELMFRQYATGCEPIEAQIRATDYMKCGDLNKDGKISLQEFNESAKPAWAECVKESGLRRAHGFVKFFDADANMDGFLTPKELMVGMILLWGKPGEQLAAPLLKCADKNKDGKLDQKEFHNSIAAYNPGTRTWQMWNGTSDKEILKCMQGAFTKFDAALVFHATDKNGDTRISESEAYNVMAAVDKNGASTISSVEADAIFKAADKDKDKFLNFEEFMGAGEAYKGPNEQNGKVGFLLGGHAKWPTDTYDEGYGMSVACHDREGNEWRVFSDDLGKVTVTPTDDQGAVKVTMR